MSEQTHSDGSTPSEDLKTILARRAVIDQAKGILMERYGIDGDAAFAVLTRISQHTNRKLRDIAGELVATGQLPEDPSGPGK